MDMRKTYLEMIRAFPGGWDAMAGALGMSRDALENRIYERKGQSLLLDTALQLQAFSGTTLLAEAVARQAGGVFMQLPEHGLRNREEMLTKFNELHARLGDLSNKFSDYTRDDEIDRAERRSLEDSGQQIHRTVAELLALTFSIYCRPDGDTPARVGGCQ